MTSGIEEFFIVFILALDAHPDLSGEGLGEYKK